MHQDFFLGLLWVLFSIACDSTAFYFPFAPRPLAPIALRALLPLQAPLIRPSRWAKGVDVVEKQNGNE